MKKTLIDIYVNFIRLVLFFVHKLGLYRYWSKLYRKLYQDRFIKIQLPTSITPSEAQKKMNLLTWSPDKAKEMWDSVGSPHWVQHCINEIESGKPQPPGALDCDDFASWATNVIANVYRPVYLCQGWQLKNEAGTETAKMTGHAICIYRGIDTRGYFYCGNWGHIGPFNSVNLLVKDMLHRADGGNAVSWAAYDKRLKLIKTGNGIPNDSDLRKEKNRLSTSSN
jgi:hypothetical protein